MYYLISRVLNLQTPKCSISTIYERSKSAIQTGKPILLTNITYEGAKLTPIPVTGMALPEIEEPFNCLFISGSLTIAVVKHLSAEYAQIG